MEAGLDPARFWELTPRLLMLELSGAKKRMRRQRELIWFGAMLPYLEKKVTLAQFVGEAGDDPGRIQRFHDAWDRIDKALTRH